MHQPDYRDPHSPVSIAPWVRLRALKDYLDMLLLATEFENVKVTFNLVPSLIEQFGHYMKGGSDIHLELTRLNPAGVSPIQKLAILENSFKCHSETMIKPYSRYNELFQKWQKSQSENGASNFSENEIRDLQIWSNLTWVDPLFRTEEPVKSLLQKERNFVENDKIKLIDWQLKHIGKIIPAYQKKFNEKSIDISFSPYFHPILPLLCDSNSAREALPEIKLPANPFVHPEDARIQIKNAITMFENLFGAKMQGMWPSEGSISDESLKISAECGINWSASDEQILFRSLQKNGLNTSENHPYTVYRHASGIKLFFRDHILSDKIGFVYSSWDPQKAAEDFISHIKSARNKLTGKNGNIIVPVILDGENSWEFYNNDGLEFLRCLYKSISEDREIDTITFSEAAQTIADRPLNSVFSGSWIDHNFRIWIGHQEDNTAWDFLQSARDFLTEFQKNHPTFDQKIIESAWREIYIAEGSDWFWWYGDEHRGTDNHLFDKMFRSHLIRVYELLKSEIPLNLRLPIISQVYKTPVLQPDSLSTPQVDGKISHFYEWFGAGLFQCQSSDSTRHRVFSLASSIYFSFDHENFYLRMDFANLEKLKSIGNLAIRIKFNVPDEKIIFFKAVKFPFVFNESGKYTLVLDEILEMAVNRKFLWTDGIGKLAFSIEILENEHILEKWPEGENLICNLPEKNKELFWYQ